MPPVHSTYPTGVDRVVRRDEIGVGGAPAPVTTAAEGRPSPETLVAYTVTSYNTLEGTGITAERTLAPELGEMCQQVDDARAVATADRGGLVGGRKTHGPPGDRTLFGDARAPRHPQVVRVDHVAVTVGAPGWVGSGFGRDWMRNCELALFQ